MPRYHATAAGPVQFTAEEELARDAEEAAALIPKVPQEVPKYALDKALIEAGLDDDVETVLAAITPIKTQKLMRAQWNRPSIRRNAADLVAMLPLVPITPAQADALFIRAAEIART